MQENSSIAELSKAFIDLKRRKNCLVLAHNYVDMEIQNVADYVGDSLQMAQFAARTDAELILVCSIRIMGQSVSLLNRNKKVIMAHADADCELANMQSAESLDALLAEHPGTEVVCYVNSPMALRARSTITCTSANCLKVLNSLAPDREIIFIPDSNIGRYAQWKTGRELILTGSYCYVHQQISLEEARQVKAAHPDYTLLVHPECRLEVCQFADVVCSTSQMIGHTEKHDKIILGTETGLYDQLRQRFPQKEIVPLSAAMVCRDMKKLTLSDAYRALEKESFPVEISKDVRENALKSLNRMLSLDA